MAAADLPCDGDGVCMRCRITPPDAEVVPCRTCATPWHVPCLSKLPETMASVIDWLCPDCSPADDTTAAAAVSMATGAAGELIAAIRAIEADVTLTEQEKARRRQRLMSGSDAAAEDEDEDEEEVEARKKRKRKGKEREDVMDLLDEKFNCSFCMQLPERPVTTPCGHNFCLKCFQKWIGQGKHTCAKCRAPIPSKMASQPRINATLVAAIRVAKTAKSVLSGVPTQVYHFMRNEERPEKAFTTDRAKRAGKANACSGQIFVTVPPDHFGPILAENDPKRNRGVLVGDVWEDRMECRQWGAHFPHVAGIAGQGDYGAQSVALSGGYEDDEDHGEWFLYTGSGGRDLSGNKRTNKEQSFDQKFEKLNEALRVSCKKGYPVRVVRSHKEKRSSYAPEAGVRYDGIYRIEKCWRKVGIQGFKVCRYLFVRCENEPAPWTSDEHGDRPRPLPVIKELKNATDVMERKECPFWDFDEEHGWRWMRPPPVSKKPVITGNPEDRKRARKAIRLAQNSSVRERLLKEFGCLVCRKVMTSPLTTPCGHNFCKPCLLDSFADKSFMRERTRADGRSLRAQKIIKICPGCPTDISEFLQNAQVNAELMDLIESLKRQAEEEERLAAALLVRGSNTMDDSSEEDAPDVAEDGKAIKSGDEVDEKVEHAEIGAGKGGKSNILISASQPSGKRKYQKGGGVGKKAKSEEASGNTLIKVSNEEISDNAENGEAKHAAIRPEVDAVDSGKRKYQNAGRGPGKRTKKIADTVNEASSHACTGGAKKSDDVQLDSGEHGGEEIVTQNAVKGAKASSSGKYERVARKTRAAKKAQEAAVADGE